MVPEFQGFIQVMGDKDNCFLHPVLKGKQLFLHLVPDKWIKGAESFVHEQDIGVVCKRPCDAYPLFHSSAKLGDFALFVSLKPYILNRLYSFIMAFVF